MGDRGRFVRFLFPSGSRIGRRIVRCESKSQLVFDEFLVKLGCLSTFASLRGVDDFHPEFRDSPVKDDLLPVRQGASAMRSCGARAGTRGSYRYLSPIIYSLPIILFG